MKYTGPVYRPPFEDGSLLLHAEEELKEIPEDYLAMRPERGNEGVAILNAPHKDAPSGRCPPYMSLFSAYQFSYL